MSATKRDETHTETWGLSGLHGGARVVAQCSGASFVLEKDDPSQSAQTGLGQAMLAPRPRLSISLTREEAEALLEVLTRFLRASPAGFP